MGRTAILRLRRTDAKAASVNDTGLRLALGGISEDELWAIARVLHSYGMPHPDSYGRYPKEAIDRWLANTDFLLALCHGFKTGIVPLDPPFPDFGMVYIVGFDDYVKIGYSGDLRKRLPSLQTGSPRPLIKHHIFLGKVADEVNLHARFARYRLSGEWFVLSDEIKDWIANRREEVGA